LPVAHAAPLNTHVRIVRNKMGLKRIAIGAALALVATTGALADAAVSFTSEGGQIKMNGTPLQIKGLNWHGFQTTTGLFHGIWSQPFSFFFDFLVDNQFNALRVPMDLDLMLNDRTPGYITPEPDEGYPSPLASNTSLEILDWFVAQCADRGILIMLDMHCLDTSGTNASPVFYSSKFSRQDAISGWKAMAERYANAWNVFAIDVFNEPFGGTWAEGQDTDMDAFAVDVAAAVHESTDWLIMVEGTSNSPNCTEVIDGDTVVCGYGDNLLGVAEHPVQLGKANKLVYSPHTYGPSQHARDEFTNADFPNNMPDVWENHWGYIRKIEGNDAAVVLGEWGGPVTGESDDVDNNGLWMSAIVDYLVANDMQSNFFWCLNSDSDPTGVVVDWSTFDEAKLALLATLTPEPTDISALYANSDAQIQ